MSLFCTKRVSFPSETPESEPLPAKLAKSPSEIHICMYMVRVRVTVRACHDMLKFRSPDTVTVPGRFVPMHFRSQERNDHIVDVSFSGTKLPSNVRSHELSTPTTVALLGSRPTRYSGSTIMSYLTMTIAYV